MQQSRSEVTERDGLVELSAGSDVLDSPRYNHDIAPTRVEQRTWNRWHTTALSGPEVQYWWCGTPAIALAR